MTKLLNTPKLLNTRKLLLASAVISLAACSTSDQPPYNQQSASTSLESAQTSTASKPVLRRSFSGSVTSDVSISANQTLDLTWGDGVVKGIVTTDSTGDYQVTLPEDVELPAIIEVASTDGDKNLKALVYSLEKSVELSALSTVITEEVIGDYIKGQAVNKLTGLSSSDIDTAAGGVINKVFGHGLTLSDIQNNDQLNRALMTALKNLNDKKSTLSTLRSAINDKDTSVSGSLLSNSAFQTVLAGAFSSQKASSDAVMSLLSTTGVNSEIAQKMSNSVASFDAVKQMAEKSDVNNAVVDKILEASSKVASEVLQGVKPEDLPNMLGKVLEAVSPALVEMVTNTLPEKMNDKQVSEVVDTVASQAGKVLADQAGQSVANMSDAEFEQVKGQLSDVAKLVGGPVGDILSGSVLNGVSKEQASAIVDTIGDNLGVIAGTYIDQLGKGALPEEALSQASLAAAPVAESIGAMLIKDTVQNATPDMINALIKTVGQVSLNQITNADSGTDASAVQNVLNVVTGALSNANLSTDQVANIVTSPDQTQNVVSTLTQAVTTLIDMTQQGSIDAEDTQSGANLIENVVKAVLPVITNVATETTTSQADTAAENTPSEEATSAIETVNQEETPKAEPVTPAPFTLIVDGKETTVVDAIATAAQNMFINLGQQAFSGLFSQPPAEG